MTGSLRSRVGRFLRRPGPFPLRYAYEFLRPAAKSPYGPSTPHYDAGRRMFYFHGGFREIGRQFARALSMRGPLKAAKRYIANLGSVRRAAWNDRIGSARALLDEHFPEMRELIRGVCDFERTFSEEEVLCSTFATVLADASCLRSCSSVACRGRFRPIVGQNLDLGRTNATSVAYIVPADGRAVVAHVSPGYLWFGSGVNEDGLCVAGSSTCAESADPELGPPMFPQELISGCLLWKARDVAAACDLLRRLPGVGPGNGGLNLNLADRGGAVRTVEVVCDRVEISDDAGPVWITTNHLRSPALARLNRSDDAEAVRLLDNSRARHERAIRLLENWNGDVDRIRALLREPGGGGEWCRNATPPDEGYTSASYLFDLENDVMEYWHGILESDPRPARFDLSLLFRREPPS